jgi:tetratricopeptide (TPR) repeat protein
VTVNGLKIKALAGTLIGVCGIWLSGCTSLPDVSDSLKARDELLDGGVVFGETVSTEEAEDVHILETSDDLLEYVHVNVGKARIPVVKFRRIFRSMIDDGFFQASYLAETTRTAAETFEHKSGNCLSYTNLFIAMAREAGLDARYQVVSVPPSWDADSGFLIRYTHVNVLMKGFAFDSTYGKDFSVDFNDVLPDPEYPRKEISDAEATSLFYTNRSIGLLRAGEHRQSFAYLKKAIEHSPENADLWINLGAFYSKQRAYEQALQAYEVAQYFDPSSRGAISGLGRTHRTLGHTEQAEIYQEQVRRYRARNPYYHFAVAQAEFEKSQYDKALEAINAAIDLNFQVGRFHFLKGLTQQKLGDYDDADASFRRAERYGNYRDLKRRYKVGDVAKLQSLG